MKWISVKDGPPELNVEVLAIDSLKDQWIVKLGYNSHTKEYYWEAKQDNENCCSCIMPTFDELKDGRLRIITHWRPIPAPPADCC